MTIYKIKYKGPMPGGVYIPDIPGTFPSGKWVGVDKDTYHKVKSLPHFDQRTYQSKKKDVK